MDSSSEECEGEGDELLLWVALGGDVADGGGGGGEAIVAAFVLDLSSLGGMVNL